MMAANQLKNSNGSGDQQVSSNNEPSTIEDLYKYFGILADAKENAGQHADVYLKILSGTKAGIKEKQLASQFITRFFSYFPKEMLLAIDAIFDLCEDEDVNIRKAAIKDLSVLCKDCTPDLLNRISDILTQLLQTDDQQEFLQVQSSLLTAFKRNPKSTLNEIFNQINTAELEQVRKRAIKFLVTKMPILLEYVATETPTPAANKEFEDLIIKNVKQVLLDVDAEEFLLFIRLLTSLPSMNTLTGRQDLVNIIMSQSELDKPYDETDVERSMILMSCMQQALPLFSKNVPSTRYVHLYLHNVLIVFKKIKEENVRFEILKAFAELCIHYNGSSLLSPLLSPPVPDLNLKLLYDLVVDYLPMPVEFEQESGNGNESQATNSPLQDQSDQKFNFSYVECFLYAFHTIVKFNVDFFASTTDSTAKDRLRDFRIRLQYFAKGTQAYIKELRNSISTNLKEAEENKIRRAALRVTTNIDTLIKDFFHNPPVYKSSITLSWKAEQKPNETVNQSAKRSLSVDVSDQLNRKKPERGIYQPPSGKYSNGSNNESSQPSANNSNKKRTFSYDPNRFTKNNKFTGNGLLNRNGRF